jgi:plastocyanin
MMRWRTLPAVVLAAGAAAGPGARVAPVDVHPGPGAAPGHGQDAAATTVSIGFSAFTPPAIRVLPGDVIRWTNDSVRAHTVTADDGSFDSGSLPARTTFERHVPSPGVLAYHCTLHAGMIGTIDAETLLLDAPERAAAPGHAFPLGGRAALAPGTSVRIQADTGQGFTDVASTVTEPGGTFGAQVTPRASAFYRAVAGDAASPPVALLVLDHTVTLTASHVRGQDTVRVRVTPPDRGADVVLQLRIPERFGWWPVRHARLGEDSGAQFVVRTRRRLAARVQLTLRDMATPLSRSRLFHVGPPPSGQR